MGKECSFAGTIMQNAFVKTTKMGDTVCSFTIQAKEDVFLPIRAFCMPVEMIKEFLTKGRRVCGVGYVGKDKWKDRTGTEKEKSVIVADLLEVLPNGS